MRHQWVCRPGAACSSRVVRRGSNLKPASKVFLCRPLVCVVCVSAQRTAACCTIAAQRKRFVLGTLEDVHRADGRVPTGSQQGHQGGFAVAPHDLNQSGLLQPLQRAALNFLRHAKGFEGPWTEEAINPATEKL